MNRVRAVAREQKPFAAFLGCADSRVPIEIVFDQGFGDLFVTRIAGNVASSENIGSLEFGTQVLGAKVLYVLGHTDCGAVNATMKGTDVPGQISGLFQYIRPAVKTSGGDLNKAVRQNVLNQAILLAEASPVISKMIQRKELIVAGGIYDLGTGVVTAIDCIFMDRLSDTSSPGSDCSSGYPPVRNRPSAVAIQNPIAAVTASPRASETHGLRSDGSNVPRSQSMLSDETSARNPGRQSQTHSGCEET